MRRNCRGLFIFMERKRIIRKMSTKVASSSFQSPNVCLLNTSLEYYDLLSLDILTNPLIILPTPGRYRLLVQ